MEVNIVRVYVRSGHAFDIDAAKMLDAGELETDSFDAAGEGAAAISRAISQDNGLTTVARNGRRTLILINSRDVVAVEEREVA